MAVGLCQLLIGKDKEANLANAQKLVQQAVNKGAQLVLLPVRVWWVSREGWMRSVIFHTIFHNLPSIDCVVSVWYFSQGNVQLPLFQ